MRKSIITTIMVVAVLFTGCGSAVTSGTAQNARDTISVANKLTSCQPTPTDIDYSLERYNLIRRAYWVNGQREKAGALICEVEKPLGYIVLFSGNAVVGKFVVDGKVSCLNSFLSADYIETYYTNGATITTELSDVDGSYGENDAGIFFFTPDGKYVEWTGDYLYSDIPFEILNPVVSYEVAK